jgi:hypothetical protein
MNLGYILLSILLNSVHLIVVLFYPGSGRESQRVQTVPLCCTSPAQHPGRCRWSCKCLQLHIRIMSFSELLAEFVYRERIFLFSLNRILIYTFLSWLVLWLKYVKNLIFSRSAINSCFNWFFSCKLEQNAAYLILRGLKTLDLRVTQQNRTASLLASKLEAHPKVCNFYCFQDLGLVSCFVILLLG